MVYIFVFKIIISCNCEYFCLEHSGRGRKAKNEDSNEHQMTPNVTHKKRAAIESRHLFVDSLLHFFFFLK